MKNYLLCILMIVALFSSAQNPSNDNNWVLNESLSDEFNGTTINQEKWSSTHHWGACEDKGNHPIGQWQCNHQWPRVGSRNVYIHISR